MKKLIRVALFGSALLCASSFAQNFPTRSISMVVPYPPGGSSDGLARIISQAMAKDLGQQVIVENVTGAGGTIGDAYDVRFTLQSSAFGGTLSGRLTAGMDVTAFEIGRAHV